MIIHDTNKNIYKITKCLRYEWKFEMYVTQGIEHNIVILGHYIYVDSFVHFTTIYFFFYQTGTLPQFIQSRS